MRSHTQLSWVAEANLPFDFFLVCHPGICCILLYTAERKIAVGPNGPNVHIWTS